MSDFQDKAVEKIMKKFFNYVITTSTWFINYMERKHNLDPEDQELIAELKAKVKELRDMETHFGE